MSTKPSVRRVQDIEEVVRWAFRDELPKQRDDQDGRLCGPKEYGNSLARYLAHGTVIDESWVPRLPAALGPPHPDALIVKKAVDSLKAEDIDITGFARRWGADPAGVDVDAIADAMADQAAALVTLHARRGNRPGADENEVQPVRCPQNGKVTVFVEEARTIQFQDGTSHEVSRPVPVDTHKRGGAARYPLGAFTKITYTLGRVSYYTDRAAYAVWRAALTVLAERLQDELTSIRPSPPAAPQRPWDGETDAGKTGRVLPTTLPPHIMAPVAAPRRRGVSVSMR